MSCHLTSKQNNILRNLVVQKHNKLKSTQAVKSDIFEGSPVRIYK